MRDLVVIDLETTSLDPLTARVIEIGAVRLPQWTEFRVAIDPDGAYAIDPAALAVNRYEERRAGGEWDGAIGEHEALTRLRAFAEGAAAAFYGAAFDAPFLDAAERRRGLAPRREWGRRALDLPSLAWAMGVEADATWVRRRSDGRRWSGAGVAVPSLARASEALEVEAPRPGERHTALGDARAAARVVWALTFGWGSRRATD